MRNFAVLAVLVSSYLPANAEVSADLRFCGGLKSKEERLACYDAAARIAAKPAATARPVVRVAPSEAQAAVPLKALAPDPLPVRNPFDGYYAAIGGGYGVVSERSAYPLGAFDSTTGGSINAVAGRNIGFSWGVVGIEVDGRWLGEKVSLPSVFLPGFLDTGIGFNQYRYQNDLALHAALRLGVSFGDSLVFAKAGFGVNRITEQFTVDNTGILFCDPARFTMFVSCSPTRFGSLSDARVATWVPSAILGLGIEQNWGPIFARFGVDFEAIHHRTTNTGPPFFFSSAAGDSITWATRGTALLGVRF